MDDLRAAAKIGLQSLIAATGEEQIVVGNRQFKALVSPADEDAKALAGMQVNQRGLVARILFDALNGQLIGLKEPVHARGEEWRIAALLPSTVGIRLTLKAEKN